MLTLLLWVWLVGVGVSYTLLNWWKDTVIDIRPAEIVIVAATWPAGVYGLLVYSLSCLWQDIKQYHKVK